MAFTLVPAKDEVEEFIEKTHLCGSVRYGGCGWLWLMIKVDVVDGGCG